MEAIRVWEWIPKWQCLDCGLFFIYPAKQGNQNRCPRCGSDKLQAV